MWPWEHAALGYLLYSLGLRAFGRSSPTDVGFYVLLFATQLPDLVDKPLAWGLGVFRTGHALGHSVFVAAPLSLLAAALAVRRDRPRLGIAFVVGYWSHILSDVLDPLRYGEPPMPERALWPLVIGGPYEEDLGLARGLEYLERFLASLATTDSLTLVVVYLLLPLGTVALWVSDGMPGLGPLVGLVGKNR